jgi:hypothetical protein
MFGPKNSYFSNQEENIQHSKHGESLKSRRILIWGDFYGKKICPCILNRKLSGRPICVPIYSHPEHNVKQNI